MSEGYGSRWDAKQERHEEAKAKSSPPDQREKVREIVSEHFKPWAYQGSMSVQSAMHQAIEVSLKCLETLKEFPQGI